MNPHLIAIGLICLSPILAILVATAAVHIIRSEKWLDRLRYGWLAALTIAGIILITIGALHQ